MICEFGGTSKEATISHNNNLHLFLQRARERGLKLNIEKVKLRLNSVPFIGHLLTEKGLAPDLTKACAITNMPIPTNVKSLQQLLGMVQYLSKFLPQLSTVTEPLRQLVHKEADWQWTAEHDSAVCVVKDLICKAPVLCYFDPALELTLLCDASESGLGYALLQQGQPVAFGARGMTQAERKYAQIEKEMLAIVCGCENLINLSMDTKSQQRLTMHKPLVSISHKLIHNAPKCLQRMLLHMQRYDFNITYKKGSEIYLADQMLSLGPTQTSTQPHCHSHSQNSAMRWKH